MAQPVAEDESLAGASAREGERAPARGGWKIDLVVVLAILVPGLGHVCVGRFRAGLAWFLAVCVGYYALVFLPGVVLHAASIWSAQRAARARVDRLDERRPLA